MSSKERESECDRVSKGERVNERVLPKLILRSDS